MAQEQLEQNKQRCQLDIGKNTFVVAKTWKDAMMKIHVRKFERSGDRNYPTKCGIALKLKHWVEMTGNAREVDESVSNFQKDPKSAEKLSRHIGSNVYVEVYMYEGILGVDIRQWFWDEEKKTCHPTKKGIFLHVQQWEQLKLCFLVMTDFVPELKDVVPCSLEGDHQNQEGMLRCSFCNPNDCMNW